MEDRNFNPGDVVVHFKRETVTTDSKKYLYVIITEAVHTETGEKMMVYQSVEDGQVYVRPYGMFVSRVDRIKYPKAKQEYRFEKL